MNLTQSCQRVVCQAGNQKLDIIDQYTNGLHVLPGQTVSVRRIYKLLLMMLLGKKGRKWPPLPDSKEAEWSLQDLLFIMSGHAVKPDRFYYHVRYSDIKCWIFGFL